MGGDPVMRRFFRAAVCFLLLLLMAVTPLITAPSTTAAAATNYKIMRCNVEGGRLRMGPGNYGVITTLDKGEKVIYSGKMKNAFCLVATMDGRKGYIYKNFLSNYGVVRSDRLYHTVSRNVKLYKKASTGAKTVATLKNRQFVTVYQKAGNWAYVKTMDGRGGYIQLSKIKRFS